MAAVVVAFEETKEGISGKTGGANEGCARGESKEGAQGSDVEAEEGGVQGVAGAGDADRFGGHAAC